VAERRKAPKGCYWRGPVLWGRIQVAGKEYKWSLRTGDAETAKRRLKAERARLLGEAHFGEIRYRYEDVVEEWSAHIVTQVGAGTAKRYASSLAQLKTELLPLFIDQIDKAKVNEIVKRRRSEGVTTATIRRDLTALSSVLEYAEDQEYREGNPALARLRKLKERRDPISLPHHTHIARVAQRADQMIAALIRTALSTGCRQSELVNAERVKFDEARRQLTVKGKGNKIRTVDLDADTAAELAALPACLGCKWLFWTGEGEPFRGLASTFRYLVRAEMRSAQKSAQEKGLKQADFQRFTFHHLRHRHAVDWLKSGKSLYDLQKRLGHTSIKTTEIYLAYLTPEEQRVVKGEAPQKPAQSQRFIGGKAS
jgi:integrase/recombinase XerD